MNELPDGWASESLSDICLPVTKADPVSIGRERVRYVDIGSIDSGRHRLPDVVPSIDSESAPSRCRQLLASGDTVFSTVRPYLEKIAFIGDNLDGEFASTGFCVLRPGPRVLARYLFHFSVSHQLLDQVLVHQRGVSYPAVLDKNVKAATIPVPPLDEQRRIVDILEDHLSRLDAATELLASAERRASAWSRSFVDATLWDGQYPQIQVADLLAEPMRNGHSARAVRDGLAGIRTLTLTAVTRNEFTDEFTKVTSADPDRVKSLWLRSGDLLVQRANTPQLVGTTAMFDGPDDWAIYPDLLIRLRANEERVVSGYLCAAMRSERAHRQMRSKAKGLAGSMPKIDQAGIGATTVPVPDMDTQQALLLRLSEVQSVRERTTEAATAAGSRAQVLRNALLVAAFSGRLTGRTSDMEMVEEMAGV